MGFWGNVLKTAVESGKKRWEAGIERAEQMSDDEILYYLQCMEQLDHRRSAFDECVKQVAWERGLL